MSDTGIGDSGMNDLGMNDLSMSNLGMSNPGLSNLGPSDLGISELGLSDLGLGDLGIEESSLARDYSLPIPLAYDMDVTLDLVENDAPVRAVPSKRRNGSRPAPALPLRRILEAILFAVDRPVAVDQLLCAVPQETLQSLECELQAMADAYRDSGAGFRLVESGEGYWLRTDPELHEYVDRFLIGKKRSRLSRAAMESLAIIAYRQPITRGEVEEIRGVDCGQVLHTLMERNLVTVRGRSQALGRPLLYGTTEEFLHYFGIRSLADLPSPEELQALLGSDPLSDPEIREALNSRGLADEVPLAEESTGEESTDEESTDEAPPDDAEPEAIERAEAADTERGEETDAERLEETAPERFEEPDPPSDSAPSTESEGPLPAAC